MQQENHVSAVRAVKTGWSVWKRQWWLLPSLILFSGLVSHTPTVVRDAGLPAAAVLPVTALCLVIGVVLEVGLVAVVLESLRGKRLRFGDVFSAYPFAWRYFLANVLFMLIVGSGLILAAAVIFAARAYGQGMSAEVEKNLLYLSIVPLLYFALRFQFYAFALVDRRATPAESLRESWHMTQGQTAETAFLWVLLVGVNVLGILALGVGIFFSFAVSILAMGDMYRQLSRPGFEPEEEEAEDAASAGEKDFDDCVREAP